MKKNIIKLAIAGAIAIVGTVGYNFSVNQNDANFQFTMDNVEALARGESGSSKHTLDCGKGAIKLCKATCGRCQVTLEVWGAGSPAELTCPLD